MFPHGRISRRSVLRLAALGAVGGLIAACGSSSDSTTEAESTSAAGSSSTTTGTTTGTTTASPAAGSGSSTTTSSSSGKTDLTLTLPAEPGFLNPVMVSGDRNFSKISWQLYDSLLVYDFETKQLQPQLATKWEMKDETTWEFTLREGVQFHQGYGELTADDVEFMVNLVVSQNKPLKFLYFFVESAKATGTYTVEYKLSQSFAPFLVTTARDRAAMIVSKKAYEEMGEEKFNRNPVGTGPFEFVSWKSGQEVKLKKFDQYWQEELPYLTDITYRIVGDTITRESLLKTGEVDFIDAPDYKNVANWKKDNKYVVTSVPSWGTDWMPYSVTVPPFDKKELRQAISYAVDREALVQDVYYGEAQADQGPLAEGYIGYPNPTVYPLKADTAKAKELLAAAGFPDGFKTTAICTAQFKNETEIIAGQLAEVGIEMTVEVVDPGTSSARTKVLQFEVNMANLSYMTPDSDSTMYWFYHTDTVGNYGYNNPDVDKALEAARVTDDPAKRAEMYQSIIKTVLEDAPYTYLLHPNIVRIYKDGLQGVPLSPQDPVLILNRAKWA